MLLTEVALKTKNVLDKKEQKSILGGSAEVIIIGDVNVL